MRNYSTLFISVWFAALLFCLFGAAAPSAEAQPMRLTVGVRQEHLRDGRDAWQSVAAGVGWKREHGDTYGEVSRSSRFGRTETRILIDLFQTLSDRVYTNARVHLTPQGSVHPVSDILAEVYATLDHGWEPALQVRRMAFERSTAWIGALAVAAYREAYYMRVQGSLGSAGGPAAGTIAVSVRRYWTDVEFVQLRGSIGQQVEQLADQFQTSAGYALGMSANFQLSGVGLMPEVAFAHDRMLGSRISGDLRITLRR